MTHAFYIYSAWGISAAVLAGVIGFTWLESGRLQRELKRLEAQGIKRRSADTASGERA
jgi:heme exporter protein D